LSAHFRLADPQGRLFGAELWVEIVVNSAAPVNRADEVDVDAAPAMTAAAAAPSTPEAPPTRPGVVSVEVPITNTLGATAADGFASAKPKPQAEPAKPAVPVPVPVPKQEDKEKDGEEPAAEPEPDLDEAELAALADDLSYSEDVQRTPPSVVFAGENYEDGCVSMCACVSACDAGSSLTLGCIVP
jgi:hypothetical protein